MMPLLFIFKKIAGRLIMPVGLSTLLLVAGLAALYAGGRRSGRRLVLVGTLILVVLSMPAVADHLAAPLENRYPVLGSEKIPGDLDAVVVLSGGVMDRPDLPPAGRLGGDTLQRTLEGIRLWKLRPKARLILCGGPWEGGEGELTPADSMAELALSLGVDQAKIVPEKRSRDTYENAVEAARLMEGGRFALVTSARHLPRAVAIFKKLGLKPIPAPADHRLRGEPDLVRWLPSASGLSSSHSAIYEYLGFVWYWLRGRL